MSEFWLGIVGLFVISFSSFGAWYFWATLTSGLVDCEIIDLYSWLWSWKKKQKEG